MSVEDNDKLVWIKGFGTEQLREKAQAHHNEVVRPTLPEYLRDVVGFFKCRAIRSQYFSRLPDPGAEIF